MRVSVERTGGVAGLRLRYHVSSDDLGAEERGKLEELVAAAEAVDVPAGGPERARPDAMHYRITIEKGKEGVTHAVNEPGAPQPLLELAQWVRSRGAHR
jgi:hypothetical protein